MYQINGKKQMKETTNERCVLHQQCNVFAELGHSQEEIAQKLKDAFPFTVFYGPDDEKFYFEAGDDMGYFEDTGNVDAHTRGYVICYDDVCTDGHEK